jgi:hypothetical protein
MRTRLLIAAILISASSAMAQDIFNITTPHNLESPKPADCVAISDLSSSQNPPDLFAGFKKCIPAKEYRRAAALFYTAMIYGTYDAQRVADISAGQAIEVLRREAVRIVPPSEAPELEAMRQSLKGDRDFCSSLKALGKPSYYPRYMTAHGAGVPPKKPAIDGILTEFEPDKTWQGLLSVAKCD